MGNFASCGRDDSIDTLIQIPTHHMTRKVRTDFLSTPRRVVDSLKNAVFSVCADMVSSLSGSSIVISEVDERWYQELLGDIDTMKTRCQRSTAAATDLFLGPSDRTVASINSCKLSMYTAKTWSKSASNEDDDSASYTTDETDDESKCDYSDSDASECEGSEFDYDDDEVASHCCSCTQPEEVEYYNEDDDAETKADRLLRLASMSSTSDAAPVYVEDYLCPCGECPQYERIAHDVQNTVTWRGVKEQATIIRVLQAFSTYNEVIGYHPDMIAAAEECLQLWLGDEDRALKSFVMLYDEVPQLCAGHV